MLNITITAKIRLLPTEDHVSLLQKTIKAYRNGCNFVSNIVFESKLLKQASLHKKTYSELRTTFALRSQMAQSVMKSVIARYKIHMNNGRDWEKLHFKKPEYDLIWNRDYSLTENWFSLNTLKGRIKVPYISKGMERYFKEIWSFGTAKLIFKHSKCFLHIPVTMMFDQASFGDIRQVVGIDLGKNFLATTYDSHGKTAFIKGKKIKNKRERYRRIRKQLQQKNTPSAKKRLKEISNRENRWITNMNHCVSKALITKYGENTLFVVEDLCDFSHKDNGERILHHTNCLSWPFYQLRQMLEYKANMNQSKVIAVEPKYTSLTCPKCGHTEKANRNKKLHLFDCETCHYKSNDDRIAAINLQLCGIEYIVAVTEIA